MIKVVIERIRPLGRITLNGIEEPTGIEIIRFLVTHVLGINGIRKVNISPGIGRRSLGVWAE